MKKFFGFIKAHKKPVIFLVVLVAIVALGIWIKGALSQTKNLLANMQNSATTEIIETRDITKSITATGTIVAVENRSISTSVVGVDVKELNVSVGDKVNAGDVICVLDSEEYEKQLAEAQTSLNADAGRVGIDVNAQKRNLNDAVTTKDINAQRAEEDKRIAYNHVNEAAEECEEAQNKYKSASDDADKAKSAMNDAKDALDRAKAMNGAAGEPSDDIKNALMSSAAAYNSTVDAVNTYGSSKGTPDYDSSKLAKFADTTDVTSVLTDNATSQNTSVVASDLYSGEDAEVREELAAKLDELKIKAGDYEQSVSNYTAAVNANASLKAQMIASAETEYAKKQAEYEAAKAKQESLEASYDAKVSAVEAQCEAYDRTLRNIEDIKRNDDMTIAARNDGLQSSNLNASTATIGDKRSIRQIEEQLDGCVVTASINGMVTAVNVIQGEKYNGGAIVTIEDTSKYEVSSQIDEYDIARVEVGQSVIVKTNGTGTTELEGVVKEIAPHATASMAADGVKYEVRISILTPNDDLKLDMTAKIEIICEKSEGALSVTSEAIQVDDKGEFFVEILDDGEPMDLTKMLSNPQDISKEEAKAMEKGDTSYTSHKVTVTKGVIGDYYTEIIGEGLEDGMEVVIPNSDVFSDINAYIEASGAAGGI